MEMNRSAIVNLVLFLVVGVIVVGLGYRWFQTRPQRATETSTKVEKNVTNKPTTVPTVVPQSTSKIIVFAAGTQANSIYPKMELLINDVLVRSWENVRGEVVKGQFDRFEYVHGSKVTAGQVRVRFVNHETIRGEERILYVDRINIDGKDILTDAPTTLIRYTEIGTKCISGYNWTRRLLCNGYIAYDGGNEPVAMPGTPEPPATAIGGTPIRIYAAGTSLDGVYPEFQLAVRGVTIATYGNVRGDWSKRQVQEFVYIYPGSVEAKDVRVTYTNDAYRSVQEDRNLFVDRLEVNGRVYPADAANVYSNSYFDGTSCKPGYMRSKQMSCNGYLQFESTQK